MARRQRRNDAVIAFCCGCSAVELSPDRLSRRLCPPRFRVWGKLEVESEDYRIMMSKNVCSERYLVGIIARSTILFSGYEATASAFTGVS